jgi:hypothetical protein
MNLDQLFFASIGTRASWQFLNKFDEIESGILVQLNFDTIKNNISIR